MMGVCGTCTRVYGHIIGAVRYIHQYATCPPLSMRYWAATVSAGRRGRRSRLYHPCLLHCSAGMRWQRIPFQASSLRPSCLASHHSARRAQRSSGLPSTPIPAHHDTPLERTHCTRAGLSNRRSTVHCCSNIEADQTSSTMSI